MDQNSLFTDLLNSLELCEKRLNNEKYKSAFNRGKEILNEIISHNNEKQNYSLFQRILSDSIPWDEEFLEKCNNIERELKKVGFLNA